MRRKVVVNDRMQKGYVYHRTEPVGRNFAPGFTPELTPKQMLALGVFGGKYMTDCRGEFPASWFVRARLCAERHDPRLNCFGVNASQSLGDARVGEFELWHIKDVFGLKKVNPSLGPNARVSSMTFVPRRRMCYSL
jgi:hypothetical protein